MWCLMSSSQKSLKKALKRCKINPVVIMKLKRVYIEITNVCNLNCSFCSPLKREKGFMDVENFLHILNEIKPYNPHIYLHIKGEPLMHPQFENMLKAAYDNGFNINITTNGTLIKKYEKALTDYARQINISVHSLSDNQIKNTDEYIASVCQLGCEAKNKKSPYISYRMWNGEKGENISDDALLILNKISSSFGLTVEDTIPKSRDAKKLYDNIFISFMEKFEWPSLSLPYISDKGKCLGAKEMIGILVDGTVVPCCLDANGDINLGNIFEKPLKEILESERFKNIEKGFSGGIISEELCKRCSYRTRFDKV